MRKLLLLVAGIMLLAAAAAAQDSYPRVEIFGGASYFRAPISRNFGGWHASLSANLHKNFGLVADLAGQYGSDGQGIYEYMLGPRLHYRADRATFFAHALYGGLTAREGLESLGTDFLMAYGAGVDVNLGKRVALRVVQLDYLARQGLHSEWENHLRASVGIVFRLGGQK